MKVKLISICLLQALNWVSADKIRLAEVTAKDRQTLIEPFMYLGETFFNFHDNTRKKLLISASFGNFTKTQMTSTDHFVCYESFYDERLRSSDQMFFLSCLVKYLLQLAALTRLPTSRPWPRSPPPSRGTRTRRLTSRGCRTEARPAGEIGHHIERMHSADLERRFVT